MRKEWWYIFCAEDIVDIQRRRNKLDEAITVLVSSYRRAGTMRGAMLKDFSNNLHERMRTLSGAVS
jgi:hypothetical protein